MLQAIVNIACIYLSRIQIHRALPGIIIPDGYKIVHFQSLRAQRSNLNLHNLYCFRLNFPVFALCIYLTRKQLHLALPGIFIPDGYRYPSPYHSTTPFVTPIITGAELSSRAQRSDPNLHILDIRPPISFHRIMLPF